MGERGRETTGGRGDIDVRRHERRRSGALLAAALVLAAIGTTAAVQHRATPAPTIDPATAGAEIPPSPAPTGGAAEAPLAPTDAPTDDLPTPTPTLDGLLDPDDVRALGLYPELVYVPNNKADTMQIIDPVTMQTIAKVRVGRVPHHITPSWDLTKLYVDNTSGNSLSVVDPATGEIIDHIHVDDPYNLYFTPDGRTAIVVAERLRRLDLRDPDTWELRTSVPVPRAGVDHGTFTRDGRYFVASAEFSGWIVKVDIAAGELVQEVHVGGEPIDVVRIPGSDTMLVANQASHGVHVIDAISLEERSFIPTGRGAHGILLSRDRTKAYVSNRRGGSISVLDLDTLTVVDTWDVGGSPDMGALNPDGTRFWISNRYHASVSVIDTTTGEVVARIPTDAGPHGLTYFPSEDRPSIGHNGVYLSRD